jgi:hypothetical protein
LPLSCTWKANLEYKLLKKLFLLLKVKNNPLKHWLDNNGSLQDLVMFIFAKANYFVINANEVTIIA